MPHPVICHPNNTKSTMKELRSSSVQSSFMLITPTKSDIAGTNWSNSPKCSNTVHYPALTWGSNLGGQKRWWLGRRYFSIGFLFWLKHNSFKLILGCRKSPHVLQQSCRHPDCHSGLHLADHDWRDWLLSFPVNKHISARLGTMFINFVFFLFLYLFLHWY